MNKTLYFTRLLIDAEKLAKRLRKDPQRDVALMDWADSEMIRAFNCGEYTDLVTMYTASGTGFRVQADVIVHDNVPIKLRDEPLVKQANNRAPNAVIIYRYSDHFEYDSGAV